MQKSLAAIRREAGFETQEQFCSAVGVERGSVAKWETGRTYPRPPMLPKLASALKVTEGEIIAAMSAARDSA